MEGGHPPAERCINEGVELRIDTMIAGLNSAVAERASWVRVAGLAPTKMLWVVWPAGFCPTRRRTFGAVLICPKFSSIHAGANPPAFQIVAGSPSTAKPGGAPAALELAWTDAHWIDEGACEMGAKIPVLPGAARMPE